LEKLQKILIKEISEDMIKEEKSRKKSKLGVHSEFENFSNLNNISMMTFEGSLYSGGKLGLFDHLREKRHFDVNSNFFRTQDTKPQSKRIKIYFF
jgi:hypothetical protein